MNICILRSLCFISCNYPNNDMILYYSFMQPRPRKSIKINKIQDNSEQDDSRVWKQSKCAWRLINTIARSFRIKSQCSHRNDLSYGRNYVDFAVSGGRKFAAGFSLFCLSVSGLCLNRVPVILAGSINQNGCRA